ncbi:MAG TPA: hypothetical protein VFU47_14545, partial [Armatimonadota bacterium]|nr:hypothetical protein [Armatimonadota bacterium]
TGALLLRDLRDLLGSADRPRTVILAGEGGWLQEAIETAHAAGARALVWTWHEAQLSVEVRAAADDALGLASLWPAEAGPSIPRAASAAVPEGDEATRTTAPPQPANLSQVGARLTPWSRLLYHAECILRKNGWTRVPFRRLAAMLADFDEFGPSTGNTTLWLNRAKAEGMLIPESEPSREDPSTRIQLCRPNLDHPTARYALEVPDRCLRLLHQMLQKIPWVSFKLLRNVLMREQWLGGAPFRLDEAGIDEWLNFLIQDGAIRMTKEPNLVNPDYPVTALRLNEQHPLSGLIAAEATETTRLATERAILAVDHFLTRNRKPWMAMSALRRALSGLGRDELQSVLQELQHVGALVTESYPNPQREHYTTGCRLRAEVPLVGSVLSTRNTFIRITQYQQRYRSWVPLAQLGEELRSTADLPASESHCLAWILLLRDEGILELDHEGVLPGEPWESVHCRLNVADAVVRAVVASSADEARGDGAVPSFHPP